MLCSIFNHIKTLYTITTAIATRSQGAELKALVVCLIEARLLYLAMRGKKKKKKRKTVVYTITGYSLIESQSDAWLWVITLWAL